MSWPDKDITLNVANINTGSEVNGPGRRLVIWLRGCSIGCPGCINAAYCSPEPERLMPLTDLLTIITSSREIEGVTYSGGEPFEQPEGLYHLSKMLRYRGLSVLAYSGFTYEELATGENVYRRLLLSQLDVLIDGRYDHNQAASLLWRGSSNQRVIFLTDRYSNYQHMVNHPGTQLEIRLEDENLSLTGNFSDEILRELKAGLKRYGIILDED